MMRDIVLAGKKKEVDLLKPLYGPAEALWFWEKNAYEAIA